MDEKFINRAFGTMGEQVVSVRIIRNKMTGWASNIIIIVDLNMTVANCYVFAMSVDIH